MIKIRELCLTLFGKENPPTMMNNYNDFLKALQNILELLKYQEVNDSFRVFEVKDDIREWSKQHYRAWEQSLTLEEKKNIKLYTSNSFKFNAHLRQRSYPRYKSRIQQIDSALEKSSTPENIITFRWLTTEGLHHFTGSTIICIGTKFLERGYSSSTLVFNGNLHYYSDNDVLFILKIPKYFTGACLKDISNIPTEDEFLLKRNTTYTVEKIIYYTETNAILLCNVY